MHAGNDRHVDSLASPHIHKGRDYSQLPIIDFGNDVSPEIEEKRDMKLDHANGVCTRDQLSRDQFLPDQLCMRSTLIESTINFSESQLEIN